MTEVPDAMDVHVSLQTDPGCVRDGNEDAGSSFAPSDPDVRESKGRLTVVADGMGGHLAGEVASKLAVELIGQVYYGTDESPAESLKIAFETANRQIYEFATADKNLEGMGTTCTALVLQDGKAIVAHVGDSRLYLVRDGEIYLMTEDHSAVREMVKLGIITSEEARYHEDKNVIIRALGTSPNVEVSFWESPLAIRTGDLFLLCSDGLHDLVDDETIRDLVLIASDPHTACESLIDLAKRRGGNDNITVGVLSIKPGTREQTRSLRATREVEVAI